MPINPFRPAAVASTTERPVPRWAEVTAHAIPFVLLPQCLWRLPFAFDFSMGMIDPHAPAMPWWGPPYVFGLSLLTEGLALLSLGLVRGWGETVPAWMPLIGGRRIPPVAVVIPAMLGGLILTGVWGVGLLGWFHLAGFRGLGYTSLWWEALARVCIGTAALWGPMVLALTYAYHRRRTPIGIS